MATQPISTKAHGAVDYLVAGMLVALPRALGWSKQATNLLTFVGLGTLGVSALTNYEFSLAKVIPFRTHLMTDVAQALLFIASPLLLKDEDKSVLTTIAAMGASELVIVALSDPEPFKD